MVKWDFPSIDPTTWLPVVKDLFHWMWATPEGKLALAALAVLLLTLVIRAFKRG
jgi:hypothetical protein